MNVVGFCAIDPLDVDACLNLLNWVRNETPNLRDRSLRVEQSQREGLRWLIAHCDDGVTWGRWSAKDNRWQTAFEVFPELSPEISRENLIELRLFGPEAEYLIWRTGQGLRGRCLRDAPGTEDILAPMKEQRLLLGDRLLEPIRHNFSRVGSPTGSEQVVPCVLTEENFENKNGPLRIQVKHYLQQDPDKGVVRVAATRLVDLGVKGVSPCHVT